MKSILPILLTYTLLLVACSETTGPNSPLVVPAAYGASNFASATAIESQMVSDFEQLITLLKVGKTPGANLDIAAISDRVNALNPFFSSAALISLTEFIAKAADASGLDFDPMMPPTPITRGGVYGSYYFNSDGIDAYELPEKYLFAPMLYMSASTYLYATPTDAKNVDKALACFGASPDFSNTDKATTGADRNCAKYAARRDKADGKGLYTAIKNQFLIAQAAAKGGSYYTTEYQNAVSALRKNWEKSQMACIVNYCYTTITKLSATTVTDADRSSAMHSYGEAVGFALGWKSVPATSRQITDAQLNEILALLQIPSNMQWSCFDVWQKPVTTLPKLEEATKKIQTVYGFTDLEMTDFRQNWVSVQNRQ